MIKPAFRLPGVWYHLFVYIILKHIFKAVLSTVIQLNTCMLTHFFLFQTSASVLAEELHKV